MLRLRIRPRGTVRVLFQGNRGHSDSEYNEYNGQPEPHSLAIYGEHIATPEQHIHYLFQESQEEPINTPADPSLVQTLCRETYSCDSIHEPCSICLDSYEEGDELLYMPCRHTFHSACLHRWLHGHNTCPVCRHVLTQEESTIQITVHFPNTRECSSRFTRNQRIGDLMNYIRLTAIEFGISPDILRYQQLAPNLNLSLAEAGLDRDLHLDMRRCV
jgi:hypothetical protein